MEVSASRNGENSIRIGIGNFECSLTEPEAKRLLALLSNAVFGKRILVQKRTGIRIPECDKKVYESEDRARKAHAHFSWRIRTYFCKSCKGYHVANHEKGKERI